MGGWRVDANNWGSDWTIVRLNHTSAVCLSPASKEADTVEDLPWFSNAAKPKKDSHDPVKVRLWSPPIPATAEMRCLTLLYSIKQSGSLGLLQRQEGCFIISELIFVCLNNSDG